MKKIRSAHGRRKNELIYNTIRNKFEQCENLMLLEDFHKKMKKYLKNEYSKTSGVIHLKKLNYQITAKHLNSGSYKLAVNIYVKSIR